MQLIEQFCNRFEVAWRSGERPSIEGYISEWSDSETSTLLHKLLLLEWDLRQAEGEVIVAEEYCMRFPEESGFIIGALSDIEFDETVKIAGGRDRPPADSPVGPDAHRKQSGSPGISKLTIAGQLDQVELHAKGGLGEVYSAQDTTLNRKVAIKRIKTKHANNPDSARRFFLEAEITGRLEHPGIVPVYSMGTDEKGQPFYAMKFIRGETLHECIIRYYERHKGFTRRQQSLEFRSLLNHFRSACHAIDYAHSRGVIHRDIKPDNIMLGKYGETLVVDWGLARIMDDPKSDSVDAAGESMVIPQSSDESSKTLMGQAVGTPSFMSPEQADGRLDLMDERTDVYGLGATLYFMLTGERPFSGDVASVIVRVREGRFARPRAVRRQIPQSLEAICLKAMKRDPAERYATVGALAEDVESYLDDQAVAARREPIWAPVQRFLRKHQNFVLAGMLVLAVCAAGLITNAYRAEKEARNLADQKAESVSRFSELFAKLKLDGRVTGLLGSDYKEGDLLSTAEWILEEVTDDPTIRNRLLDSIGDHFAMTGQLELAEKFLIPPLVERRKHPENVVDLATSLHHVAFLRWIQGYLPEAIQMCGEAIKLRSEALGEDHENTVASKILYLILVSELIEANEVMVLDSLSGRLYHAWLEVLNALEQEGTKMDPADLASIRLVMTAYKAYDLHRNPEISALEKVTHGVQLISTYLADLNTLKESGRNHPGRFLALRLELRLRDLPGFTKRSWQELLNEINDISTRAFNGNESHPGNLFMQLDMISTMPRDQLAEDAMTRIHKLAQPVFAGQPRLGYFDKELAELLFHRGMDADEGSDERKQFFARSEQRLKSAIKCWKESLQDDCWQIAQANKRLARIARERGDLEESERIFRKALVGYKSLPIQGHFIEHQAKGELAEVLVRLGRADEAKALEAERRKIRIDLRNSIPEVMEKIFAGAPMLGIKSKD